MKKLLILTSLLLILPTIASAASFAITPSSGSYTNGKTVTLQISVDPAGSTIYTAMLDAKFSPSSFEVISFTLNDAMLTMKQAGYDSTDNVNGLLIKTGGYVGGINSVTPFGTLVLKAKGTGAGTFTINSSSKLLDSNNVNKQVGSQFASFTISNKTVAIASPAKVKKSPSTTFTNVKAVTPPVETPPAVQEATNTAPIEEALQPTPNVQTAAVVEIGSPSYVWLWILLVVVVIIVLGWWIYRRRSDHD